MRIDMNDGYELLAQAIIVGAVTDYRKALRKLHMNPAREDAIKMVTRCEKFFRSQWYRTLTSVDGEFLIEQLRKEVQ